MSSARLQGRRVEGTELQAHRVSRAVGPTQGFQSRQRPPRPPPGPQESHSRKDEFKGVDCTLFFLALEFCCQDQFPGLGMSHPGSTARDSVNESGMLAAVGKAGTD